MAGLGRTISHAVIPAVLAASVAGAPAVAGEVGVAGPYLAARHAERQGDIASASRLYAEALSRDAQNLELLEGAMTHQIAAGNVAQGLELARRLLEVEPDHHLAVLVLAAEQLRKDDPAAATELLGEEAPFVGQVIDAWAAYADGDAAGALEMLSALEKSEENGRPGQIVAAYHQGLIQAATGDDEAAVESFARAAEMTEGGTLRLARLHAGALARLGRKEEAMAVISNRLEGTYGSRTLSQLSDRISDGAVPEPLVTTAEQGAAEVLHGVAGLLARGQNRIVALAYSRLATWLAPELTEARLLIAQILHGDRQYEQAIAAYEAIPSDAPEALTAQIGEAQALQDSGRVDDALAAMRATVERFPDALEAHTALGDMLRRETLWQEAAAAYDRAIALLGENVRPQFWPLFYQRGIAYERSKQWDRAEADFRKALELEPDQPDVLNYLGYTWVERGEHLAEAEEMIRKAVEQRPDDGYIVDSLGWVLFRFGEFEKAAEELGRAVELRPVDPVINDHYGDALWMIGRKTEARFQWKRALSFEPEDDEAERIRAKLDKGLDAVLAAEEAEGQPGIIGRKVVKDAAVEAKAQNGG